jgi:serine protease Do
MTAMAAAETEPHALTSDVAAVVARLREITVEVRTTAHAGGSGVIWRSEGLIVTSAHVVLSAHGVRGDAQVVLADRRRLPAALIGWDGERDLALLRVQASDLPAATVGNPDDLRPGELVLAVGHPFGLAAAVMGVVHAAPTRGRRAGPAWIQADLRLAPGNSGGPLADARGLVVGINAMIAGGLALAVPSPAVQAFVMRTVDV